MKWFADRSKAPRKAELPLAADAFSDGQIASKLWLCRELEKVLATVDSTGAKPQLIWVLAGWQGLLPFLIFSREKIPVEKILLFDLDERAVEASLKVNDRWRFTGKFAALAHDVRRAVPPEISRPPDIVINTSCEHFSDRGWWSRLPKGAVIALQSTDMSHEEHVGKTSSAKELRESFSGWSHVDFEGELSFDYGSFAFTRHMVIGRN